VPRQEIGDECGVCGSVGFVDTESADRCWKSDAGRCGVQVQRWGCDAASAGLMGAATLLGGRLRGCAQGVCVPFQGGFGPPRNTETRLANKEGVEDAELTEAARRCFVSCSKQILEHTPDCIPFSLLHGDMSPGTANRIRRRRKIT